MSHRSKDESIPDNVVPLHAGRRPRARADATPEEMEEWRRIRPDVLQMLKEWRTLREECQLIKKILYGD